MAKPILTYLSKEELESIHTASTRLLEKTGARFPHKPALDLFREGGASVDYDTSVVKIPSKMVEDALERVPKEVHLYARDPKSDIHVTDISRRWPLFGVMTGTVGILDMKARQRRPFTKKDLIECSIVTDACENIDCTEAIGSPMDVPLEVTWQHAYSTLFKNYTKHVVLTPETQETTQDIIKMGIAVAGGEENFRERPLISIIVLTVPPLNNDGGAVAAVLEALKYGIQIRVSAGTMAGASSPVTLAGCLAQANAEALSWMVLVQLANPGPFPAQSGPLCAPASEISAAIMTYPPRPFRWWLQPRSLTRRQAMRRQ
jgi:trimethylamine--corrinoid protein Co-methyltransferase